MLKILRARLQQGNRTMKFPSGPPPELPERFTGWPVLETGCLDGCAACVRECPTGAISRETEGPVLDTGLCLFCRSCETACGKGMLTFCKDYRLAAASRSALVACSGSSNTVDAVCETARRHFGRSFKLRQVSAGGCNACEADCNVLGTPAWDMARFGIQFVASPRHADGLLVTGPVTANMREALLQTWEAVPAPKVVIAAGACAISGGLYADHEETCGGVSSILPVDLYIPGCPPHPLTILDGLLRFLGRRVP